MDLINVILPNVCTVCHAPLVNGEDVMCLKCQFGLPQTGLYKFQPNLIHERVVTLQAPVVKATSYFWYYKDNEYAALIHDAKYNGRSSIAVKLAKIHANELENYHFFDGIDLIMPVPMYFIKQIVRGYNQSEKIAEGISEVTGLPIGDNLIARKGHSTQTRKGVSQRNLNTKGIYEVRDADELDRKHILIVDDVITTGATIVECINTIHKAQPTARFSVFSLALTHLR
ncbi:MAG: ComF family protein [Muribaculum sp.]|nr:ComF family protein [Muribaculum sp.]